jgi:hypothetical protein
MRQQQDTKKDKDNINNETDSKKEIEAKITAIGIGTTRYRSIIIHHW